MSLYDGLDLDQTEGGTTKNVDAGWSSGFKLLQSQLQAKKANLTTPKRPRQGSTLAPVIDLKRNDNNEQLHFNLQTGRLERIDTGQPPSVPASVVSAPFIGIDPVPSITGVQDEYDPLRPNEYDEVVKKRREAKQRERDEEKRREAEEGRSRDRRRSDRGREEDGEMERAKRRREEEEEEYEKTEKPRAAGAAIAPPMSLLEEAPIEASEPIMPNRSNSPPMGHSMGLGGSVASRIMAKYGYKEGQGLGKQEQGMSTALYVEKTSKRGGKIIHEKDMPKVPVTEVPPREAPSNTNLLRNPSKVLLLRNMVGPGEVDDDLEPETAEECSKYGRVLKVVIFEIPGQTEDEAVRIFVEFERMESAIKGLVDLNGRYFGGKIVKACFYNLDKFRRLDLADPVE